MKKNLIGAFVVTLSFLLVFSVVGPVYADEKTQEDYTVEVNSDVKELDSYQGDFSLVEEDTIQVLSAIENMPEEIIFADQEVRKQWIEDYAGIELEPQTVSNNNLITPNATFGEYATCAGALGTAALLNLTPVKLLKVKSALKSAGGATTFVKKFAESYKVFKHKEKKPFLTAVADAIDRAAIKAGPEAKKALLDLFGLSTVVGACSAVFD